MISPQFAGIYSMPDMIEHGDHDSDRVRTQRFTGADGNPLEGPLQGALLSLEYGRGTQSDPLLRGKSVHDVGYAGSEHGKRVVAATMGDKDSWSAEHGGIHPAHHEAVAEETARSLAHIPIDLIEQQPVRVRLNRSTDRSYFNPDNSTVYAGGKTQKNWQKKHMGDLPTYNMDNLPHEMGHATTSRDVLTNPEHRKGLSPLAEGIAEGFKDHHLKFSGRVSPIVTDGSSVAGPSLDGDTDPNNPSYGRSHFKDPSEQALYLAARAHARTVRDPGKDSILSANLSNTHMLGMLYSKSKTVRDVFKTHFPDLHDVAKQAHAAYISTKPPRRPEGQFQLPGI